MNLHWKNVYLQIFQLIIIIIDEVAKIWKLRRKKVTENKQTNKKTKNKNKNCNPPTAPLAG